VNATAGIPTTRVKNGWVRRVIIILGMVVSFFNFQLQKMAHDQYWIFL
jgi:hypothetical protein